MAQHSRVERRADRRDASLEADPAAWLLAYLPQTYSRPFEAPHREIIARAVEAIATGGRYCVAAPRGLGKTSLLWGVTLWAVLTGRSAFPVVVAWSERAAKRALAFWRNALAYAERLVRDYWSVCGPFAQARGLAQKVAATWWGDTGAPTHAALRLSDGLIQLPDSRGGLGAASIGGNVRGLNLPLPSGELLRPTLVLVDDVQDRDVARSPSRVRATIERIDADIAGLGNTGASLPILMAANCIAHDDVAAHYLASPSWRASRIPCVVSWPDGFFTPGSRVRALWDQWHEARLDGDDEAARRILAEHREEMERGLVVSAPVALTRDGRTAAETVMHAYYTLGHDAFVAEYQQQPVTPDDVPGGVHLRRATLAAKVDGERGEVPPWAVLVVASTDINPSYGLTSVIVAYGVDQTARVVWHGITPLSLPATATLAQSVRTLYAALRALGVELVRTVPRLHAWAIDAGGQNFDVVTRFADASPRVARARVLAMTGRASHRYVASGRTVLPGDVREHCHGCATTKHGRTVRWVVWDADYWAEAMQRAVAADVGTPGGLSFARGDHRELYDQLLAVRLAGKADIGGRAVYRWTELPGKHDYHDALAQAYAAAAYLGVGTLRRVAPRRRETRRCRVPID